MRDIKLETSQWDIVNFLVMQETTYFLQTLRDYHRGESEDNRNSTKDDWINWINETFVERMELDP